MHATQQDLEAQLELSRRILSGIAVSYNEYLKLKPLPAAVEERKKLKLNTAVVEKQITAVQDGTRAEQVWERSIAILPAC